MKKKTTNIGIVTYTSLYCDFTNYGTVLQTWALMRAVKGLGTANHSFRPILIDYCPDSMKNKSPLDPVKNMWDTDEETRKLCELSLPAIRVNFEKIKRFYHDQIDMTQYAYSGKDFDQIPVLEHIGKFICGSDSIFDIDEFGMDEAFYANLGPMRKNSIAYAPSFQDSFEKFTKADLEKLALYMDNFIAISIREKNALDHLNRNLGKCAVQACDPTLLIPVEEYGEITAAKTIAAGYLLYYSRRYNPEMDKFVDELAEKKRLKVMEISLRASNSEKHDIFYSAGIEEFLALVKYADCVVTNSYHCMIFSILFEKDFYVFSREHCNNKIYELLSELNLLHRFYPCSSVMDKKWIDYQKVNILREDKRKSSLSFLRKGINALCGI